MPDYVVVALHGIDLEKASYALSAHAERGYRVISTVTIGMNVVWTLELVKQK